MDARLEYFLRVTQHYWHYLGIEPQTQIPLKCLIKLASSFRIFLFYFASLLFHTLYHKYVLISWMGYTNDFFSEQASSDLYRKCLYSCPVIPEALYFQNRWSLGIEQLCFFFAVDFTLLLQVCLASALFLTTCTLQVSGPFVNTSQSFCSPKRNEKYLLAHSWKCKLSETKQFFSRKGP